MKRLNVIGGLEGRIWSRLMFDRNLSTSALGTVRCFCMSSTFCMTSEMNTMIVSKGNLLKKPLDDKNDHVRYTNPCCQEVTYVLFPCKHNFDN